MRVFVLIMSLLLASVAPAQESAPALGFQEWKDQQVLDAQNQVLRASARVTQLRTGKSQPKRAARLPNDKVRTAVEDEATLAERELKRAQDYLTNANKLTFANYIDVYLPSLKDNPASLQRLSEKLTKDELAQIFRALMNLTHDAEARQNLAVLQTLALGNPK